jgi:hypothetical protein
MLFSQQMGSYEDYAQALEFDQLKVLMKEGTILNGFNEGRIDFPPTFKYDVLRTSKRSKRQTPKVNRLDPAGRRSARLTELDERDIEESEEEDVEGASLASSMMTSFNSRPTTEPGMQEENSFHALPVMPPTATSSNKPALLNVASRVKAKWLTLLSPLSSSLTTSPSKPPKMKQDNFWPQTLSPPSPSLRIFHTGLSSDPNFNVVPNEHARRRFLRPSYLNLVNPSRSGFISEDELQAEDKGVYDSSHKRRVPSW